VLGKFKKNVIVLRAVPEKITREGLTASDINCCGWSFLSHFFFYGWWGFNKINCYGWPWCGHQCCCLLSFYFETFIYV